MDVELKVEKILSGELQPGLDRILVEFGANGSKDDPYGAKRLQAMLPDGQSIWFLQWMATRPFPRFPGIAEPSAENRLHYQITDHSSVFAQGESGVVAPMAPTNVEAEDPSVKDDATRSRKLSELVDRTKGLKTNGRVD